MRKGNRREIHELGREIRALINWDAVVQEQWRYRGMGGGD